MLTSIFTQFSFFTFFYFFSFFLTKLASQMQFLELEFFISYSQTTFLEREHNMS